MTVKEGFGIYKILNKEGGVGMERRGFEFSQVTVKLAPAQALINALRPYGEQGWELVSVCLRKQQEPFDEWSAFLQRPIEQKKVTSRPIKKVGLIGGSGAGSD